MLRLLPKDYRNLRDSLENRFSRVGWAATMLQKAKPFSMRRVYQPSNTRTKPRAVFVTCGGIATICAPFTRPRYLLLTDSTLISAAQMLALDARIVLHDQSVPKEDLPRFAIRPYPEQYSSPWKLRDGASIIIR